MPISDCLFGEVSVFGWSGCFSGEGEQEGWARAAGKYKRLVVTGVLADVVGSKGGGWSTEILGEGSSEDLFLVFM